MRPVLCSSLFLFVACLLLVPLGSAQQSFILQLGTPPGQPTMPIPMGVVNLQNGNVYLEFPLRTYVQRNGAGGPAFFSLICFPDVGGAPPISVNLSIDGYRLCAYA